jgi:hypothetical protein
MTIRELAFAASLGLGGCGAADQMSESTAGESPGFREPGETAAIRKPTPTAQRRLQNPKRIDTAKTVHQKPPEKESSQRLSQNSVAELPLDAPTREALFRKFLRWRERQLSAPQ